MGKQLIAWGTKDFNTSAQLILAKRLGFFHQEGLQVTCKLFPGQDQFFKAFEKSGPKPFICAQTVPELLQLRAKGYPLQIISPLAEISASYQMILRENSGIVLPGDLENKTIGIVRGSLIEVALRNVAKDFGIDFSKIRFIHADPVRQLELFVNEEIHAMACWEPWTSQAQYVGGSLYFSGLYSKIPGHEGPVNWLTAQSMLVTFEEFIHSDPETLLAVLKAIYKATEYLNATVSKAASILSDLLGVEHDELMLLIQKNRYTMSMKDLFQIGLASVLNMLSDIEMPGNSGHVLQTTSQALTTGELYVSDLLMQVAPSLVQQNGHNPELVSHEIIAEGNIYYRSQAKIPYPASEPLRYVIVDDNNAVVDVFSTIVETMAGQVVGTAPTGSEGMVLYFDLLPDIVVMDVSMPDMNGIDAIKGILRMNPAANIVIISGNNYPEIRKEVFDLGVKLFIGKPFHIDQIIRVLKKITT